MSLPRLFLPTLSQAERGEVCLGCHYYIEGSHSMKDHHICRCGLPDEPPYYRLVLAYNRCEAFKPRGETQ
jgi:hypothetical protein